MEFKVISEHVAVVSRQGVLIESDWNLKGILRPAAAVSGAVLIESDWNLKVIETEEPPVVVAVLIESDWNLKDIPESVKTIDGQWY